MIGTRRPNSLIRESITSLRAIAARERCFQHCQDDHRILNRVQRVPLLWNCYVVNSLAIPGVATDSKVKV